MIARPAQKKKRKIDVRQELQRAKEEKEDEKEYEDPETLRKAAWEPCLRIVFPNIN